MLRSSLRRIAKKPNESKVLLFKIIELLHGV
jgi:hypothetical protein